MAIYLTLNVYINVLSPVLGEVRFAEPVFIQMLTGTPRLGGGGVANTSTRTNIDMVKGKKVHSNNVCKWSNNNLQ